MSCRVSARGDTSGSDGESLKSKTLGKGRLIAWERYGWESPHSPSISGA